MMLVCETMPAAADPDAIHIFAGKLFNSETLELMSYPLVAISEASGLIVSVRTYDPLRIQQDASNVFSDPRNIDLRAHTVFPGLVDVHVHCTCRPPFLRPAILQQAITLTARPIHAAPLALHNTTVFLHPYSETPWEDQLTKESLAERTVRAAVHARRTLLAGFTTVRYVFILVYFRCMRKHALFSAL